MPAIGACISLSKDRGELLYCLYCKVHLISEPLSQYDTGEKAITVLTAYCTYFLTVYRSIAKEDDYYTTSRAHSVAWFFFLDIILLSLLQRRRDGLQDINGVVCGDS